MKHAVINIFCYVESTTRCVTRIDSKDLVSHLLKNPGIMFKFKNYKSS